MADVKESAESDNQRTWTVVLGHFLPSLQKNTKEGPCISDLSDASAKTVNSLQETAQRGWSAILQNGLIPRVFLVTDASESAGDVEHGVEQKQDVPHEKTSEVAQEKKLPEDLASRVKNILSSTAKEAVERTGVLENLSMWTWGSSLSKWLTTVLDQSVQHISQQSVSGESQTDGETTRNSSSVCLEIDSQSKEYTGSKKEVVSTEKKELQSYVIIVENCVVDYLSQTKDFLSSTVDSVKTRITDSSSSVIELGNSTVQSFMQLTLLQTFKDTLSTYSFVEGLQAFSDYLVEVPDLFQEPDLHMVNRDEDVDWGLLQHEEPIPRVHVVYIGRR